jgi:hypothetical protein
MTLKAKTSIRIPHGTFPNLMDIGDYYVVNSQILKKDLTISSLDKTFDFVDLPAIASMPLGVACIYSPDTNQATNLMLKGSSGQIYGVETATLSAFVPPSACTQVDDGTFGPYFDSELGTTAGRRIVFIYAGPGISFGEVQADGSVDWIKQNAQSSAYYGASVRCLGESNSYFYCLVSSPYVNVADGYTTTKFTIMSVSKTTGGCAQVSTLQASGMKILGKTTDHKIWVATFPNGNAFTTGSFKLYTIDLGSDVAASSAIGTMHTAVNTVGIFNPSRFSTVATNPLMNKMYSVSDPNSATGSLIIKTLQVPAAGMSTPSGFAVPTLTTCTLIGAPTINTAYATATLGGWAAATECWTFADGSNEYVAVAYHASLDNCSTNLGSNQCPMSKHAIHVFKVDPTDHTKLTYKSSTTNNGFGSNSTVSMMLVSQDGKTLVAASSLGFAPLLWDSATETYLNGTWNALPLMNIHLDNSNQLFVRDFNNNLSVFSITASNNIVVDFDVDTVTYSGGTSSANVLVSSYSFMGSRQVVPVTLQISGATFTSNGSTSIAVTTLSTGDLSVPITINQAGNVTITPIL